MTAMGREYVSTIMIDFKPKNPHRIAAVLHPTMKNLPIVTYDERHEAYKLVDEYVRRMTPEPENADIPQASREASEFTIDFMNDFLRPGSSNDFMNDSLHEIGVNTYSAELEEYLSAKVEKGCDFVKWWESKKNHFPNLFKLFVKFAFVPASSAVCESEFSTTNIVINSLRNCIKPSNVNNIMIARNDIPRKK